MDSIKWYVNTYIHVSTTDRALIRDFYNRIKASGQAPSKARGQACTREQRKRIYQHALSIHHNNQAFYGWVMGGH